MQGTTKHIACMEDLGLFSTWNSAAAEKISPPLLRGPTPYLFFSFIMSLTEFNVLEVVGYFSH